MMWEGSLEATERFFTLLFAFFFLLIEKCAALFFLPFWELRSVVELLREQLLQAPLACVIHVKVSPAHQAALQMCYYLCKFCCSASGDGESPLAEKTVCETTKTRFCIVIYTQAAGLTSKCYILRSSIYLFFNPLCQFITAAPMVISSC